MILIILIILIIVIVLIILLFFCSVCYYSHSLQHTHNIPPIPFSLAGVNPNLGGFFSVLFCGREGGESTPCLKFARITLET